MQNNIDPAKAYKWLLEYKPTTPDQIKHWLSIAESVLIYCQLPTYIQLGFREETKIRQLANNFAVSLENHLDNFNKGIKQIDILYGAGR